MSAGTAIPPEEYLAHRHEPDCEYVDGQIVERNGDEYSHSLFQMTLGQYLLNLQNSSDYSYRVVSECRTRVRDGDDTRRRYRIPDLSIVPLRSAPTSIILEAPLAVVEILSPEDRFNSVVQNAPITEPSGFRRSRSSIRNLKKSGPFAAGKRFPLRIASRLSSAARESFA